jgi:hypothetical protein
LLVEPSLSKVETDLNDYWTTEIEPADKLLALTPAGGMPALAGWCGYPARMSLWLLLFGLTAQRAAAWPDGQQPDVEQRKRLRCRVTQRGDEWGVRQRGD